jgi:hypothetical protein
MRRCTGFMCIMGMLCLLFCGNAYAQVNKADSSSQPNALKNSLSLFYGSIGKESPLFNGPEYYYYDPVIKGNAYYADINAFTPGSVTYDNVLFTGVPMLYDLYGDNVVAVLYNHFTKYTLVKDKVASFDFLDHHFVRIDTATYLADPTIKPGFYDEIYNGRSQVLVKWSKNIQTTNGGQSSETYFSQSKSYFIKKNNLYYSFSSQGTLLDILKDKKKELQQYIRANQIKYRDNPEEAMVKIASYYDHLIK